MGLAEAVAERILLGEKPCNRCGMLKDPNKDCSQCKSGYSCKWCEHVHNPIRQYCSKFATMPEDVHKCPYFSSTKRRA